MEITVIIKKQIIQQMASIILIVLIKIINNLLSIMGKNLLYYAMIKWNMIHIFKPLPLKIMYLILTIELYFLITAFFYTEGYISDLFNSDEKDGFLSFISRRFYEITITAIICGIIGYFGSYFFSSDDYLKRLFTKKIKVRLSIALNQFIKTLKIKFIILIAISITITLFSFLYITCFNGVYRYLKHEWIKSSIVLFILMQIINLVSTLLGTCCRYLSIRLNDIKLFRLSLNLDWYNIVILKFIYYYFYN